MAKNQHHLETHNTNFSIPKSADLQISGASESLSLLSEPLDIRNWFSSYEYESPELGLEEEGLDKEEKSQELTVGKVSSNAFVNPKTRTEDYSEKAKNESEVLDSDSFSLSSEPPDITRWFPSYVYESPTLDTNHDSGDSAFSEGKHKKARYNIGNCRTANEKNDTGFGAANNHTFDMENQTCLNGSVKSNSSVGDNKYDKQYTKEDFTGNKIRSVLYDTPLKMMSEHVWKGKETDYHDIGSTEKEKASIAECEDRASTEKNPKEESKLSNSNNCSSWNLKPLKRSTICSNSVGGKHRVAERGRNLGLLVCDEDDSTSTPSLQGSDKENEGKMSTESGFISTGNRSARTNEVFSFKRPMENQSDLVKNGVKDRSVVDKEAALRTPLSETTNFSAVSAPEITGKWKCPQKTKPKLGPQLKQLRLEQWINRAR